jgi:hypothetical protein
MTVIVAGEGYDGYPPVVQVVRNLNSVLAGAEPADLAVEVETTSDLARSYTFSLSNGDRLIAVWIDGVGADFDPGVPATLTIPGYSGHAATGIDVLVGFEQRLNTTNSDGNLVIPDLVVRDYPLLISLTRFADVPPGSLFSTEIEWLADEGITKGCNPPANDMFCPNDPVTRGQMAAFLNRALHLSASNDDAFTDDNTSVFQADINALAASGITKGCDPPANDRYCPNQTVTRGQMAAFLNRALDLPPGVPDTFVDDDTSVFEADIDALAASGITKGCNPPANDRYCPNNPVTRGQMAAFLYRALASS